MEFKEGHAPVAENEKLSQENYRLSQEMAREEFEKLDLNTNEALEWFDKKYGNYGETAIALRDHKGELIGEKKFLDISEREKQDHSYGLLTLIEKNFNLSFVEHFFNEPELLEIAEKKGNYLRRTVQVYRDNLEKMKKSN